MEYFCIYHGLRCAVWEKQGGTDGLILAIIGLCYEKIAKIFWQFVAVINPLILLPEAVSSIKPGVFYIMTEKY
jgi:hypothetical protein